MVFTFLLVLPTEMIGQNLEQNLFKEVCQTSVRQNKYFLQRKELIDTEVVEDPH